MVIEVPIDRRGEGPRLGRPRLLDAPADDDLLRLRRGAHNFPKRLHEEKVQPRLLNMHDHFHPDRRVSLFDHQVNHFGLERGNSRVIQRSIQTDFSYFLNWNAVKSIPVFSGRTIRHLSPPSSLFGHGAAKFLLDVAQEVGSVIVDKSGLKLGETARDNQGTHHRAVAIDKRLILQKGLNVAGMGLYEAYFWL